MTQRETAGIFEFWPSGARLLENVELAARPQTRRNISGFNVFSAADELFWAGVCPREAISGHFFAVFPFWRGSEFAKIQ